MKVAISGSSGFVGTALKKYLLEQGFDVFTLVRKEAKEERQIFWDPYEGQLDGSKLEGFKAIINLSGESIASSRWSESKKRRIVESRIKTTNLLASTINSLAHPPEVFLSSSAIGIYGDRNSELLSEESSKGDGFLADLASDWEAAASLAKTRTVRLRTGIVLGTSGGALQKMIIPFKLCLGGRLGDGHQFMSWIALDDLVRAICFCIDSKIEGAVNLVSPNPVTNLDFTKALSSSLCRPAIFPLPAFVIKMLFGEMGEALFLASQRVVPEKLIDAQFSFKFDSLTVFFKHEFRS